MRLLLATHRLCARHLHPHHVLTAAVSGRLTARASAMAAALPAAAAAQKRRRLLALAAKHAEVTAGSLAVGAENGDGGQGAWLAVAQVRQAALLQACASVAASDSMHKRKREDADELMRAALPAATAHFGAGHSVVNFGDIRTQRSQNDGFGTLGRTSPQK